MQDLLLFILKCFYLMLPAYFANMAPVIVKKINLFKFPIDFNKKIDNKPVLGAHKTFRGFIFGILLAVIVSYLQFLLYSMEFYKNISFLNYDKWLSIGFLMGFGALTGDAVKSFVKRRLGLVPGSRFIPFDQTDFVIGSLLFIMPVFNLTWKIFVTSLLLSFTLHIIVNHISFYLKIRNEKW